MPIMTTLLISCTSDGQIAASIVHRDRSTSIWDSCTDSPPRHLTRYCDLDLSQKITPQRKPDICTSKQDYSQYVDQCKLGRKLPENYTCLTLQVYKH